MSEYTVNSGSPSICHALDVLRHSPHGQLLAQALRSSILPCDEQLCALGNILISVEVRVVVGAVVVDVAKRLLITLATLWPSSHLSMTYKVALAQIPTGPSNIAIRYCSRWRNNIRTLLPRPGSIYNSRPQRRHGQPEDCEVTDSHVVDGRWAARGRRGVDEASHPRLQSAV